MAENKSLMELLATTWPARLARDAIAAAKLPGDVYAGRVDPSSPEATGRVLDLAGLLGSTAFAGGARAAAAPVAREAGDLAAYKAMRGSDWRNRQPFGQRSFSDEYAGITPKVHEGGEFAGQLATSVDGKPLAPTYVAGRRTPGGPDVPIQPSEIDDLLKRATGGRGPGATADPDVAGLYRPARPGAAPTGPGQVPGEIFLSTKTNPAERSSFALHELGHGIDEKVGSFGFSRQADSLPQEARDALAGNYDRLNRGRHVDDLNAGRPEHRKAPDDYYGMSVEPVNRGYSKGIESSQEMTAEALRAYMENPAAFKDAYPSLAYQIRERFNPNQSVVQFNQGGAGVAGAGAVARGEDEGMPSVAQGYSRAVRDQVEALRRRREAGIPDA